MKPFAAMLGLAVVLTAPAALAQCNTTGIADGCTVGHPYSCAASPTCYSGLSTCQAHVCGCNTAGIATGCDATHPYACSASTQCHSLYAGCTGDTVCRDANSSGTGGGGGATGLGWGCGASPTWAPALGLLALWLPRRRRRAQPAGRLASSQA